MNGDWGDDGASILEKEIKFYMYGKNGEVPPEWNDFIKQIDPEYATFLSLKNKSCNLKFYFFLFSLSLKCFLTFGTTSLP